MLVVPAPLTYHPGMSFRRHLVSGSLVLAVVLAGCGSDDLDRGELSVGDATTTTEAVTTTESTAATSSTTTSPPPAGGDFDGATTPTSMAAPSGLGVALLTAVSAASGDGVDRVSFTFDGGVPGFDVGYIDPPVRQDGSGNVVAVDGVAFLEMRFAPAAGVDLGGTLEQTYTGPGTVTGDTRAVTEVVRTGDFEAIVTWVAGVDAEVPFRVETDPSAGTVTVVLRAS